MEGEGGGLISGWHYIQNDTFIWQRDGLISGRALKWDFTV